MANLEKRKGAEWAGMGISALNGFIGDYLRERGNGLEIKMGFYHRGRPLDLADPNLAKALPGAAGKLSIMVHGLACNESIWEFRLSDQPGAFTCYGRALQEDSGYAPLKLRYNTGLPISENGRLLARAMDRLWNACALRVKEIVLIGHSMGGLVIRSACHYAEEAGMEWTARVRRIFYLGTPHLGAPLEKVASGIAHALDLAPHPIPRLIGKLMGIRSRGIKDLGLGCLTDEQRKAAPLLPLRYKGRQEIPLVRHASHYLIAGTIIRERSHPMTCLLGDMLVRGTSAHPCFASGDERLHYRLFPGVGHMALAHSAEVCQYIIQHCRETPTPCAGRGDQESFAEKT